MANPRLEQWAMAPLNQNPYAAPELGGLCLVGEVYGHPTVRHSDGKQIRTSRLQELDLEKGQARTQSRTYDLGEPEERYAIEMLKQGYPGAFNYRVKIRRERG